MIINLNIYYRYWSIKYIIIVVVDDNKIINISNEGGIEKIDFH
jgi:hypothetical protein